MTEFVVVGGVVTASCLAGFIGRAAWRMIHPEDRTNEREMGERVFSPDDYRPMERLLLAEDFRFLEAQPGYTTEIGAEWKRNQRTIFRMYLDELKRDFRHLHKNARAIVAESGEESSELVGVLLRQQMTFWRAIVLVEVRFAVAGSELPQIDVRPVVELLDAMRLDLERFAPQPA